MRKFVRLLIALLILALLGGGGYYGYHSYFTTEKPALRTAKVERGDLVVNIGATGTLQPEEVVDIGAQVAGLITSFGTDLDGKQIDYNSLVNAGTVLAQIDPTVYQADVQQARAQLDQANAAVVSAQATLGQLEAKLQQADNDWKRAQKLGDSDALSRTAYDSYKATYDIAVANLNVGRASLVQAQAQVSSATAMLSRVNRNLALCTIVSPVKGVILDRRVNIGQTVVASLNAPSLFLLAKDLHRMEIWVQVNEADIGKIRIGQPVTYTVDAQPGRTFVGKVRNIRNNASQTQNVVTYVVEVETTNDDGTLRPYLTASALFEVSRRGNVMLVPNSALRWRPDADLIVPDQRLSQEAPTGPPSDPHAPRSVGAAPHPRNGGGEGMKNESPSTQPAGPRGSTGTVWVREGDFVRGVEVKVGATDDALTEVQSEELKEGQEVVVGVQLTRVDTSAGSFFTPQFNRGGTGRPTGAPGGPRGR